MNKNKILNFCHPDPPVGGEGSFKEKRFFRFKHPQNDNLIIRIQIFLCFVVFLFSPAPVFAAKQRVWKTTTATTQTTTIASRPSFSVKFRSDRRALNISFFNLQTASSTSYELTYFGNNLDQGVVGSANASEGNSTTRLLLFGTCSKNVCTYHQNISGMQLVITSKLNNGKTLIKRYKIKV
jgi:hypothetical protein